MADRRITELQPLDAASAQGSVDVLAVADVSAAETKKITLGAAVAAALTDGVPDGSIPGSKIANDSITATQLAANSVGASELADDSVDAAAIQSGAVGTDKLENLAVTTAKIASGAVTADKLANAAVGLDQIADRSIAAIKIEQNTLTADEIAPNAIGASELADNAVDTLALADDAVTTPKLQNASVTDAKLATGLDGRKLAAGSVETAQIGDGAVTNAKVDSIGLEKLPNAGAAQVLAGPLSGAAASPSYRSIAPSDLPTATTDAKGAVSVPASGGLSLTGDAVGIANGVTAGGFPFVNFDEHGLITGGRALGGSDLPPPAIGEIGAVKAGDGITISGDGTLSQSTTGVVAGAYPKVVVDVRGNVTEGQQLVADDIPTLDVSKIENLVIQPEQLSDNAVTRPKIADYAITFIQEAQPVVDTSVHIGCLWFQESTATLSMWNGNSFMSVGIGRLSQENLRYCGVFNAETGLISGVTQFGTSEGFEIGDVIPNATDGFTGVYFLCEVAGSNVGVLPATQFDVGDWLLCNGAAAGWVRVDIAAGGGGGGGGASRLSDLLDVSIGAASSGAILQLQDSGQWTDIYSLDGGTF